MQAIIEGYSPDQRDRYYKTPLMVAARLGNLEMTKALLELGADPNAQDNFKWTPLHHAAHSGMVDVAELLIRYGANLDAVALNGATPIFRAVECSRFNLVDYLIRKGVKMQMETRKGDIKNVFASKRIHFVTCLGCGYFRLKRYKSDLTGCVIH
ncbi:unnamed protein product [Protopolystoma xenopodis]|uniref:Uncharacterized protein n=1 Tax=Protopolystoma xenopodis TaxID=117903 RepID=A0A448WH59_9PLAT|nr:unnamed protein product [Protopolystoma xenopodis]